MVRTQTLNVEGRARIGAKGLPELIDLRGTLADPEGGRVLLPVAGADTSVQSAYLQLAFDAERSEDWDLVLDLTEFDNGDVSVEALFVNGLGRITSQAFGEDRGHGRCACRFHQHGCFGARSESGSGAGTVGDRVCGAYLA